METLIITGHLGKAPELKTVKEDQDVCNFSVAVDRYMGKDRGNITIWYDCAVWGTRAAVAAQYLHKGSQVTVRGTVTARAYMKKNGEPGASLSVRVYDFTLPPKGNNGNASTPDEDTPSASLDDEIPF